MAKGTTALHGALVAGDCNKSSRGPRSWLRSVREDLETLVLRHTELEQYRELFFAQLCSRAASEPKHMRNRIRKCLLLKSEDPYFDIDSNPPRNLTPIDPYTDIGFVCPVCADRFASKQGLASHMSKEHQTRNPVFYFVRSSNCWGCAKRFFTVSRIIQHLSKGGGHLNTCLMSIRALWFLFLTLSLNPCASDRERRRNS